MVIGPGVLTYCFSVDSNGISLLCRQAHKSISEQSYEWAYQYALSCCKMCKGKFLLLYNEVFL